MSREILSTKPFSSFFQGERLKQRVLKVCEGFHASLFHCPTSEEERDERLKLIKTRLEDLKLVRVSRPN